MRFIKTICVVAGLVMSAQVAVSATLQSGDFEGDNSVWTSVGSAGSGAFCGGANVISGSCSGLLNSGAVVGGVGIEQSVSGFVIGKTYRVELAVSNYAVSFGSTNTNDFGIFAIQGSGTTSATSSSDTLGLFNNEYAVGSFSLDFLANQNTITLQFLSQLVTDRSFIIDDVTLSVLDGGSPSEVPLPAGLPLLAVAMGALGLGGLRRRKSS